MCMTITYHIWTLCKWQWQNLKDGRAPQLCILESHSQFCKTARIMHVPAVCDHMDPCTLQVLIRDRGGEQVGTRESLA